MHLCYPLNQNPQVMYPFNHVGLIINRLYNCEIYVYKVVNFTLAQLHCKEAFVHICSTAHLSVILVRKSYSTDKELYAIVYSNVALVWQKTRNNYKVRSCLFFQDFSVFFLHSEAYNTVLFTCPIILYTSLLWTTCLLFCLFV